MTSQLELYQTLTPKVSINVSYDFYSWERYEKDDQNERRALAFSVQDESFQLVYGSILEYHIGATVFHD